MLKALLDAIVESALPENDLAIVSGIGCTARVPGYVRLDSFHTTHGRAIPFATGLKLSNPELKVVVYSGDGDLIAIGGNHFIHAARRNLNLTAIIINNNIYGMTGGQYSPTTPYGARAATALYGHIEHAFSISEMAVTAGAAMVGRGTVYHATLLDQLMEQALNKRGFAVV